MGTGREHFGSSAHPTIHTEGGRQNCRYIYHDDDFDSDDDDDDDDSDGEDDDDVEDEDETGIIPRAGDKIIFYESRQNT